MSDGVRHSRTLATKMDAEAWLAAERALIDRDQWTSPQARKEAAERRLREAESNTLQSFAERYLAERGLRPNTVRGYRALLKGQILPFFGDAPLHEVTLAQIKAWRASLDPAKESTNAASYRLLRSILQAAEEEELIDRAPPKIRGASSAPVKNVAIPATFDELAVIIDAMPDRLKLLIVLAAFVGLREGELLELRRSDVDGVTGGSTSPARSTRTPTRPPAARALSAVDRSAHPRRPRASGPSTPRRRSSRCSRSICSSTPPRVPRVCCSLVTEPTT
jgi:integrase